ncbi:unnamed protein product [Gongylonema pulchrum]|uniref:Uncharacterized protein n=1 Tax=Gongylonema pulchrum TaxID=637853 RepID=A0A183DTZ4_9BILA|nr:unnamed protein product [Gongylonema pulchrum]
MALWRQVTSADEEILLCTFDARAGLVGEESVREQDCGAEDDQVQCVESIECEISNEKKHAYIRCFFCCELDD